jgi:hypothetical protein
MSTDHKSASVQNVRILLDIFLGDSQLNVYAGELEVRPPGAPTAGVGGDALRGDFSV